MLSAVEAHGLAVAKLAVARARLSVAQGLREILPGVTVTVEDGQIVLSGRLAVDDARLRWIASIVR